MKKFLLLFAIVMFLGLAPDTFAQRSGGRSDRSRLRRGIRSGQITRDEARELRERRRQIRQERLGYRSDGQLTRDERREIRRDRREYNGILRRERRDGDRRVGYYERNNQRRGNGYYRRGAGSSRHPVFGRRNRF
jgi:hypothetical protein